MINEHIHNLRQDCNCATCYSERIRASRKYINKAMAGEKANIVKMETTEGTKIEDDGEDGCYIDYRDFHEKIYKSNLGIITLQNQGTAYYIKNDNPSLSDTIRKFNSGATRDSNEGKLEYARFMSPIILKRFAEYMDLHRKQSDGNLRDPDNWQKLFGDKHEDVCMDSLYRHLMDVWLINKGFENEAREDIESALCAILFNAQAWLFKVLMDKHEKESKSEYKEELFY